MATVSKKTAGTKKVSAAKVNEPVKASVVKKVLAAASKMVGKVKNKVAAAKKQIRVKWQDLTVRQQNALRRKQKEALAQARADIAGGGYSYQKTTKDGYDVYASNEPLILQITAACVLLACRCHKEDCVIGQAIKRQQRWATGWQVGKNICMIYNDSAMEVVRYGTSGKLARALEHWDKTGIWLLEEGFYFLHPLPANYRVGTRWAWYKGSGGTASKYKGMAKAVATRSGTYLGAIRKI